MHIKRRKGPQGTYKTQKRTAGLCALPNKPRVSTKSIETVIQIVQNEIHELDKMHYSESPEMCQELEMDILELE